MSCAFFPCPSVFLTHALWRLASRRSWWLRGCWTLRSDPDKGETPRTRSWPSCRGDKQSSKPWAIKTEHASRSCCGEDFHAAAFVDLTSHSHLIRSLILTLLPAPSQVGQRGDAQTGAEAESPGVRQRGHGRVSANHGSQAEETHPDQEGEGPGLESAEGTGEHPQAAGWINSVCLVSVSRQMV